jgi:hypothetical protein
MAGRRRKTIRTCFTPVVVNFVDTGGQKGVRRTFRVTRCHIIIIIPPILSHHANLNYPQKRYANQLNPQCLFMLIWQSLKIVH